MVEYGMCPIWAPSIITPPSSNIPVEGTSMSSYFSGLENGVVGNVVNSGVDTWFIDMPQVLIMTWMIQVITSSNTEICRATDSRPVLIAFEYCLYFSICGRAIQIISL